MNTAEQMQLTKALAILASYYQKQMPDMVLKMYARDLSDLSLAQTLSAIETYRKDPKNRTMPLPAQLRVIVEPSVDPDSAAREISGRIVQAVVKHGFYRGQEAREFIGEIGWRVVERNGGWGHICTNLGVSIDESTFKAQARDLAKAQLMYGERDLHHAIGIGAPKEKAGELTSAKDMLINLLPKPQGEA
jgi:hypothetical protein